MTPFFPLSRLRIAVLALATTLVWSLPAEVERRSDDVLLEHLRFLASEGLQGRGNHSPELERAAEYIAECFAAYGLQPLGDDGGYFQSFSAPAGRRLGPANRVRLQAGGETWSLEPGKDYVPIAFGARRRVAGSLVFAGYGISASELNYDDYRVVDVRERIVVVMEGQPHGRSELQLLGGAERTPYATVLDKIFNARNQGAAAVLLIPDLIRGRQESKPLETSPVLEDLGIAALRLSEEAGRRLLDGSGRSLGDLRGALGVHQVPYSFRFPDGEARISLDVVREQGRLRNVVGFVPGRSEEVIVVGAHYDHLGLGFKGSLAPEQVGEVHYGADDNASGTAGLLRLAREWGAADPKRGLLFITFSGEELGLLGARHYVEHPVVPLERTVAMINMDMIGRSRGRVIIGGIGTAQEFQQIFDDLQEGSPLRFVLAQSARGSSDHLPFFQKGVPVLFFFTGLHEDYHRPTDTWARIDLAGTHLVVDVVSELLGVLASMPVRPVFTLPGSSRPTYGRERSERNVPLFGIMPDMTWDLGGIRIADVLEASPAGRAGVERGDVLVRFSGRTVGNLYDFSYLLNQRKEGDVVEVEVLRDGRTRTLKVVLGAP